MEDCDSSTFIINQYDWFRLYYEVDNLCRLMVKLNIHVIQTLDDSTEELIVLKNRLSNESTSSI